MEGPGHRGLVMVTGWLDPGYILGVRIVCGVVAPPVEIGVRRTGPYPG